MEQLIDCMVDLVRVTPAGEQCFFGYYDNPAFDLKGGRHLAQRVPFRDRLQEPGDVAELCTVDLASGQMDAFATTKAWNFQQGSMLQWLGDQADTVFYNAARPSGEYLGVVQDLASGSTREVPMPLANVARDGSCGVSINFDRVFDFRPGYGYCQKRDPWFDEKHSIDDGVWLVDIPEASAKQVLTMDGIWDAMKHGFDGADAKICINHITLNPAADRFVLLARNFREGDVNRWATTVFVSDLAGNLSAPLYDACMASHYWWSGDTTLVFFAGGPEGNQLYFVDVETGKQTVIDADFFPFDGHCSTSPDGRWLLYDSYPRQGYRYLYLYDLVQKRGKSLAGLHDEPVTVTDIRCDLHPRWNRAGTAISLDGTSEGFRGIYTVDLVDTMAQF
ncbi:MAG: hypothetical protein HN849_22885 [Victivallales bacterium]|nr:hypothetical protein [Victivallales bacterium]